MAFLYHRVLLTIRTLLGKHRPMPRILFRPGAAPGSGIRELLINTLEMCYDLAVMSDVKEVLWHGAEAKHTIV